MKNKHDEQTKFSRMQSRMNLLLIAVIGYMAYQFGKIPEQLTVYTAPDIAKSFVQEVDDVPLQTIYGFARTIWETVNYCPENCEKDYPKNLNSYRQFLSKKCYQELSQHAETRSDLYTNRERTLLPTENSAFSTANIKKASKNLWLTSQEYHLIERVDELKTREQIIQYPLKIIKDQSPSLYNPWGLKIDCYFTDPVVVKNILLGDIE